MKITPEAFLAKLQESPADGVAFDRCSPGLSRRAHVIATLSAVDATIAETAALKAKLAASKAKIAALELARKSQPTLMKTTPLPVKAPTATATAASYATQPLLMTRSEFVKLSEADKSRFAKNKGKLV